MFLVDTPLPAVVLCGGLGTRLAAVLRNQPKALACVSGRPFLSYLLDQLTDAGFQHVILATGHLGEQVRQTFSSHYRGMRLTYSEEPVPLGTGGALRLAAGDLVDALVMNGDSYCDVNLPDFVLAHSRGGVLNSMVVVPVEDTHRFGSVQMDSGGMVTAFREKALGSSVHLPGLINAGIYILSRDVIESIPMDRPVSLENEIFPRMVGRYLRATVAPGPFLDVGTPESLIAAGEFFRLPARAAARTFTFCQAR